MHGRRRGAGRCKDSGGTQRPSDGQLDEFSSIGSERCFFIFHVTCPSEETALRVGKTPAMGKPNRARGRYPVCPTHRPALLLNYSETSLTSGSERAGCRSEELLQRLRIPAGDRTDRIGRPGACLTFSKVPPKMGQMIERVRIDSLLYCIGPLFVSNRHILNLPSDSLPQSFNDFPHG